MWATCCLKTYIVSDVGLYVGHMLFEYVYRLRCRPIYIYMWAACCLKTYIVSDVGLYVGHILFEYVYRLRCRAIYIYICGPHAV